MGLFGWFAKSQPEDYEQVLASLALDIQKRQTRLSEIRLRERRSTLLFSIYAIALWVAYVSLWYMNMVPSLTSRPRSSSIEKSLEAAPVYIGPILILCIRRFVQMWYTRIGDAEEKQLITARKQQREKIEDIKKKTNYYSTRTLIERYDDVPGAETPLRRRIVPPGLSAPGTPFATPQRAAPPPQPPKLVTPQTPAARISPNLQQHLQSPSPQRPLPPPRKQWYDRLADVILGDDDSASATASRYALICQRCFTHNGLVKEELWEDTQYVCPKCGHFNPSARSLRQARGHQDRLSVSPQRPMSTLSPHAMPSSAHGLASAGSDAPTQDLLLERRSPSRTSSEPGAPEPTAEEKGPEGAEGDF